MPAAKLPTTYDLRARCTVFDLSGRGYVRVSPADHVKYSIPHGNSWWWCVLPVHRRADHRLRMTPQIHTRVRHYRVFKVLLGFVRGGSVGVVGLR